jgi:hypothetical protein
MMKGAEDARRNRIISSLRVTAARFTSGFACECNLEWQGMKTNKLKGTSENYESLR